LHIPRILFILYFVFSQTNSALSTVHQIMLDQCSDTADVWNQLMCWEVNTQEGAPQQWQQWAPKHMRVLVKQYDLVYESYCIMCCFNWRQNKLHLNNACWGIKIMKILIMQFASVFCYFLPLRPKYLHYLKSSPIPSSVWQTKFHVHVKQQFFVSTWKD
jgi:hypothetical protein